MINGTRSAKHIDKVRKLHDVFGAVSLADIPDFTVDAGLTMPNQDNDGAPTECTGYTTSDILTDIFKAPFDPDFSYATALRAGGDPPGINGASFHGAMDGLVWFGGIPKTLATISAAQNGELYVSDLDNWPTIDWRNYSYKYKQNGIFNALGAGDAFSSILSSLYTTKIGVSMGSPWYPSFFSYDANGIVQTPPNPQATAGLPWHNYKAAGKKTINNIPYLAIKSWQGNLIGNGGWLYFSRETVNAIMSVQGSGALTINVNANHFISLLAILVQRFPALISDIPVALRTQVQNSPV